jgi:hypothetical protein
MIFKAISTAFIATALVIPPMEFCVGDCLVGDIIGRIIGGAIVNGANNRRAITRKYAPVALFCPTIAEPRSAGRP